MFQYKIYYYWCSSGDALTCRLALLNLLVVLNTCLCVLPDVHLRNKVRECLTRVQVAISYVFKVQFLRQHANGLLRKTTTVTHQVMGWDKYVLGKVFVINVLNVKSISLTACKQR